MFQHSDKKDPDSGIRLKKVSFSHILSIYHSSSMIIRQSSLWRYIIVVSCVVLCVVIVSIIIIIVGFVITACCCFLCFSCQQSLVDRSSSIKKTKMYIFFIWTKICCPFFLYFISPLFLSRSLCHSHPLSVPLIFYFLSFFLFSPAYIIVVLSLIRSFMNI